MMNKDFKTNRVKSIISMILIIPLFMFLFLIQSCKQEDDKASYDVEETHVDKKVDVLKDSVYTVVSQHPEFPGGVEKLYEFLRDNLRYPSEARKLGVQGRVFVTFVVKADGKVVNAEVIRSVSSELDEESIYVVAKADGKTVNAEVIRSVSSELDDEALRVINLMPDWEPGRNEAGEYVNVRYNLPISFALN